MKSNLVFIIVLILILSPQITLSDNSPSDFEVYSKVKILLNSVDDLMLLQNNDIPVENIEGKVQTGIELVLNQWEISRLKETGFNYEILIPNIRDHYKQRNEKPTSLDKFNKNFLNRPVQGFEYGSLGGFYTYDEMVAELDSMYLLYPDLITEKMSIGITYEGRHIWAVKISDNPTETEYLAEATVYYDAMHHAREPGSMAVLIYYMYWLLENYGTDPEATYLINNREMYFVPIVNADGYVYNQVTDPSGGGMWRKNRRFNDDGTFGVDLNRNYSFGWGDDNGSSSNPGSNTYRGPFAFSEPESQAVRDLLSLIKPVIAFSGHTYGEKFLNPYGYIDFAPEYEIYSEFASIFTSNTSYLYGITYEMLNYFSSGTTRDYLHSEGTYAWTPEFGPGSPDGGFWPIRSLIFPIVQQNIIPMKFISWVSGAYADFQNYSILGKGYVQKNDTLEIQIAVKNRGITQTAKNVIVNISSGYQNLTPIISTVDYDSIPAREIKTNDAAPFKFIVTDNAKFLDEILLEISIRQEGVETSNDTVNIAVGKTNILFSDNAEKGVHNWLSTGVGDLWDTTFVDFYTGWHCFADSRYGNSENYTDTYFTLNETISLINASNPKLEFYAKWAIERPDDYVRIQLSTDSGSNWINLTGEKSTLVYAIPSYTGSQHWINERIDLFDVIGNEIKIRFHYITDSYFCGDGFYFDDFRVVDYIDVPSAIPESKKIVPQALHLYQNSPNPFNPTTVIKYFVPQKSHVVLKIYNLLGEEVQTLVNGNQAAGTKKVAWNGRDHFSAMKGSGLYFYRLQVEDNILIKKMLWGYPLYWGSYHI